MKIDLKSLGTETAQALEDLLKNASIQFIKDNEQDALELGEDVLNSLLMQELDKVLPMIQPLSENPTMDEIAAREAKLKARDTLFATVAEAAEQDQERINALRSKATATALSVAKGVASIVGGILLKGVVGL